jgi:hypothetical protein
MSSVMYGGRWRAVQGRPVYIQYVGQIDMTELKKISTEERMINFHVQEMERAVKYILPACSGAAGRHIDQTFNIVDLKGAGPCWPTFCG